MSPKDPAYLDAKVVKQGKKTMEFPFDELAAWIEVRYRVNVLNIYYDIYQDLTTKEPIPRLDVTLEFTRDCDTFRTYPGYRKDRQEAIALRWREILGHDRWLVFRALRKWDCDDRYRSDKLHVIFSAFDYHAKEEANGAIAREDLDGLRNQIEAGGKTIWRIERWSIGVVFFFYLEQEARRFREKEKLKELSAAYFQLLEAHDEFGYFDREAFTVRIDSKENVDKKFDGNLSHYF